MTFAERCLIAVLAALAAACGATGRGTSTRVGIGAAPGATFSPTYDFDGNLGIGASVIHVKSARELLLDAVASPVGSRDHLRVRGSAIVWGHDTCGFVNTSYIDDNRVSTPGVYYVPGPSVPCAGGLTLGGSLVRDAGTGHGFAELGYAMNMELERSRRLRFAISLMVEPLERAGAHVSAAYFGSSGWSFGFVADTLLCVSCEYQGWFGLTLGYSFELADD